MSINDGYSSEIRKKRMSPRFKFRKEMLGDRYIFKFEVKKDASE